MAFDGVHDNNEFHVRKGVMEYNLLLDTHRTAVRVISETTLNARIVLVSSILAQTELGDSALATIGDEVNQEALQNIWRSFFLSVSPSPAGP
jgi:hypothetical protein